MYYNRKKEIIKNTVYITFILLLAIISTYLIYHKFQDTRNIDFSSESLDVTYHDIKGDKVSIDKITPVTDSVGLSSKSHSISIKNNLTENVKYKIKLLDDKDAYEGLEEDKIIPKEDIRVSVKVNKKDTEIFDLVELEEGILLEDEIYALSTDHISIRLWIKQDSKLPSGEDMYYNGIIQIIEENSSVAMNSN